MKAANKPKKVLTILFLFLQGLLILCETGWAENWITFTKKQADGSIFLYDEETISPVSSTTVIVWEKRIFPVEGKGAKNIKNSGPVKMRLWEMNCKKRTGKLLSVKHYDKNENLLSSLNTADSARPEKILPRSMGEALFDAVCRKSKK